MISRPMRKKNLPVMVSESKWKTSKRNTERERENAKKRRTMFIAHEPCNLVPCSKIATTAEEKKMITKGNTKGVRNI